MPPRATFRAEDRLTHPKCFAKVFQSKLRFLDGHMLVIACPNGIPTARLGVAVAKKHIRNAVDRNRLKRLVRESFRQRKRDFAGFDVIVVARASSGSLTKQQITTSLESHWSKLIRCRRFSLP